MTLLVLSVAYTVFTIPILPVELGGLLTPFYSMVFYSWYWWMYAINVIIYVATSKDFRDVYAIFLKDIFGVSWTPLRYAVMKLSRSNTRSFQLRS